MIFFLCSYFSSVRDYINTGLDKELIDPDNGANINRKREQLLKDKVQHHNLVNVPRPPVDGWTSSLADIPAVSYATIHHHFFERQASDVLQEASTESDKVPAARGVLKGFRFFTDGHVQSLKYHPLPDVDGYCYIQAQVLPSMSKNKVYTVNVCLKEDATVAAAFCVCVAGLAGCCNHIAATLYALDNFVTLGLREAAKLSCTSKLQQWNRPRKRKVQPERVTNAAYIKMEYGKEKRAREHHDDPRPCNLRIPDPAEQQKLTKRLAEEHDRQLEQDKTGFVAKYGSTCWLKLMEPMTDSEDDDDDGDDDDTPSDSDDIEDATEADTALPMCPPAKERYIDSDAFFKAEVEVTEAQRITIAEQTQLQAGQWRI